jgi:hypothetical protein
MTILAPLGSRVFAVNSVRTFEISFIAMTEADKATKILK